MSSSFDKFEKRILELQSASGTSSADDGDFLVLVECFLGPNYDPKQIEKIRRERADALQSLDAIARNRKAQIPEERAALANAVINASLARIRKILGDVDFEALFGDEAFSTLNLVEASGIPPRTGRPDAREIKTGRTQSAAVLHRTLKKAAKTTRTAKATRRRSPGKKK